MRDRAGRVGTGTLASDQLTKHKVLVTGGRGFVGRCVINELLGRGLSTSQIVVADRTAGHATTKGCETILLDLNDLVSIDACIAKVELTSVIHLAAIAEPRRAQKTSLEAWQVNALAPAALARALLRHAPDATLVFSGSSEAYGDSFRLSGEPLTEEALLMPRTTYGATKAAADLALYQAAFDGVKTVRFRPFNHTGASQIEAYVVPALAKQVASIENGVQDPVISVGNLSPRRDFLDVRDVARAYVDAAITPPTPGVVYNLSSGVALSISELLEILLTFQSKRVEVRQNLSWIRPNEVPVVCGDSSLIRNERGWAPEYTIEETLRSVFEYWLDRTRC